MQIKKWLKLGVCVVLSCFMVAACTRTVISPPPTPPGPTPCQKAYNSMQAKGVTLIQLGDQMKIVIPADQLFSPKSTALQANSYPTLNEVSDVLLCYKKMDVKIAAYTDSAGSSLVNRAIAQQQAQQVENYLWLHGVDARLLFPVGYGASPAVANNQSSVGMAENRRVEITFTRVTAPLL